MANIGRRKGWDALSPDYRKRLERAGINESQYAMGYPQSLAKARGKKSSEYESKRRKAWRLARQQFQGSQYRTEFDDSEIAKVIDELGVDDTLTLLEAREMAMVEKQKGWVHAGTLAMRLFWGRWQNKIPNEWLYYGGYL